MELCTIHIHMGQIEKFLSLKSFKNNFLCACVCVWVCVHHVRACARLCMCDRVRARAWTCVCTFLILFMLTLIVSIIVCLHISINKRTKHTLVTTTNVIYVVIFALPTLRIYIFRVHRRILIRLTWNYHTYQKRIFQIDARFTELYTNKRIITVHTSRIENLLFLSQVG